MIDQLVRPKTWVFETRCDFPASEFQTDSDYSGPTALDLSPQSENLEDQPTSDDCGHDHRSAAAISRTKLVSRLILQTTNLKIRLRFSRSHGSWQTPSANH